MTNAADQLTVNGNATFQGEDETGALTAGGFDGYRNRIDAVVQDEAMKPTRENWRNAAMLAVGAVVAATALVVLDFPGAAWVRDALGPTAATSEASPDDYAGGDAVVAGENGERFLPVPGVLDTSIAPPCASTMWRVMWSPKPKPQKCSSGAARSNGLKIRTTSSTRLCTTAN